LRLRTLRRPVSGDLPLGAILNSSDDARLRGESDPRPVGSTRQDHPMDESRERHDALIRSAARRLTGYQRRLFQAEVATELCGGSPRLAERRFGWGRETVQQGLHELRSGLRCREDFAAKGRKRSEEKAPQLAAAIRAIVEPHTYADPELKSARRYTNLSAAEVRAALKATGYADEELPSERTMRDILNRMNYRLKRIKKGKPLKKTEQTDAIFANVQQVRRQAPKEAETLEISMDAKAKVSLGEYVRGGKNADRQSRRGAQGLGSRPAREAEVGPVGHPDGGDRGVDARLRRAGHQ
jgi:Rhodopirellula transposase DDE domain